MTPRETAECTAFNACRYARVKKRSDPHASL